MAGVFALCASSEADLLSHDTCFSIAINAEHVAYVQQILPRDMTANHGDAEVFKIVMMDAAVFFCHQPTAMYTLMAMINKPEKE